MGQRYNPSFDGKPFRSVTQGAADLALIPLLDAKAEAKPETTEAVTNFIAFVKLTLGDAVSDVRASDRLTDSAVCLVAPERPGPLAGKAAGRLGPRGVGGRSRCWRSIRATTSSPSLAELGDDDNAFKEDAAHLLYRRGPRARRRTAGDAKAFPSGWRG